MKKCIKKLLTISILIGLISSCQKDRSNPEIGGCTDINAINYDSLATINDGTCLYEDTAIVGLYDNGYFVTNEGNFGSGNGSITFISDDGSVANNVYESTNGVPLGDVVQSMSIIGEDAYIVVNNSNKIVVASKDSMIHITEISISQPRYISQVSDNKAYVTSWGNNSIEVIDLTTNTVTNSIPCGVGPESITVNNGLAYVTNVGGWGLDNTVTVIDVASDNVVNTINVGDKPNSAQVDASGNIWVLCGGYTEYDPVTWAVVSQTQGSLVKISNDVVVDSYTFNTGDSPKNLLIDDYGTMLYYLSGGSVFSFNNTASTLDSTALISDSFYRIGYNDNKIYGTDAVDYTQAGYSKEYSTSGVLVNTYNVGIIPGGYCFN